MSDKRTKCQCGHDQSNHFFRRRTKEFGFCRYCTCPKFMEGEAKKFPKAWEEIPAFSSSLPETPVGKHNVRCLICGQVRRCKNGRICFTCCKEADELVGL